jgi:energy-converting hydrogenase Eha subunit A
LPIPGGELKIPTMPPRLAPDTRAPDRGPLPLRVVRWIARLASLASLAMLTLFATSGGEKPSAFEWLLLACFPFGVALGMIVAWFREILGGSITLASLVAFHVLLAAAGDRPPAGPWFLMFASPGLVLLGVGLASRWLGAAPRRA